MTSKVVYERLIQSYERFNFVIHCYWTSPREETFFLPSGLSDNPTPTSAESDQWMGGWVSGDKKGPSIFL